jgi:hypothetical protein
MYGPVPERVLAGHRARVGIGGHRHDAVVFGRAMLCTMPDREHSRMHRGDTDQDHQQAQRPGWPGCSQRRVLVDHAAIVAR